ncbi:MAG: hypothetical protein FJY85_15985, partial [Deltaproteobacteria bacterium]|nr:hypothetical protein [Deltaproteobacteria bacterium]
MESFLHVNGSYNASSDTLHALAAPGLVSRLLRGCFGPAGRSSLYPEDGLSSESQLCSIELNDQDSSIFQTYVEPHLEWELEPYDSTVQDLSSSAAFLDWEVPGDYEPADSKECAPDIILEDDDLEGALSPSSLQCVLVNERLRSLAVGLVIHFVGFCLFLSVPTPLSKGLGGISDKPIFVRLPIKIEINTPDIPSRTSADSLASTASLARRHPKPETEPGKEPEKDPAAELEPSKMVEKPESESRPMDAKLMERPVPNREKTTPDVSVQDGAPNDPKSSQDSMASAPSVATPERKGALKAGDETESYKDKVLSAIHQAAYFPRAA